METGKHETIALYRQLIDGKHISYQLLLSEKLVLNHLCRTGG